MTPLAPDPREQRRWFTVQCGYGSLNACTVVVEATSIEDACDRAIIASNCSTEWRPLDDCGPTYVDAVAEGQDVDVWTGPTRIDVPPRFAEHGEAITWRAALSRLVAWADQLGGWEAPCWDEARALLERPLGQL